MKFCIGGGVSSLVTYLLIKMVKLVRLSMENIVVVGFMAYLLVVVPIIGIIAAHKSANSDKPDTIQN